MSTNPSRPSNRLAQETSPYLLQHANNPVDWYPWGPEALERSKTEGKPIFLSIGYSACHWCHVMEHESFEDQETADFMNANFVNVKVDREERQDLDHIYMSAVQVMTQRGGWPMSVFLTPDLEPFYGGTYFPPEDRQGMPAFKKVLTGVANAWANRKEEVTKSAKELVAALTEMNSTRGPAAKLLPDLLDNAAANFKETYDGTYGGFGSAPKFFHSMAFKVCLRQWKRTGDKVSLEMVTHTLKRLARGGIRDQLAGGFHRYSTDAQWLVPHFEKMLYDNALLAELYLEAFQATQDPEFADVARDTLDYVLREMTSAEGAFFSTQDADSEGVEGKFYVWTKKEIFALLGEELAEPFCRAYGVTEKGNWEGNTILTLAGEPDQIAADLKIERSWLDESLAVARRKLLAARDQRVAPGRDDKILVAWNGLMIDTLAKAYSTLGDQRYLDAATKAAKFILERMTSGKTSKGTKLLFHTYKDGTSRLAAYLDDYAFFANALISLYEADFRSLWILHAADLAETLVDQFWDEKDTSFYYTARDHEKLVTRPKDFQDGALPSGAAMAIQAMSRLGRLNGNITYVKRADRALQASEIYLRQVPMSTAQMLTTVDCLLETPREFVIAPGEPREEAEAVLTRLRESFLPNKVIAWSEGEALPENPIASLVKGKTAVDGKTTLYVCENFACRAPAVGKEAIDRLLTTEVLK